MGPVTVFLTGVVYSPSRLSFPTPDIYTLLLDDRNTCSTVSLLSLRYVVQRSVCGMGAQRDMGHFTCTSFVHASFLKKPLVD